MIARLLLGAALIAGACGALGCDVIFKLKGPGPPSPNEHFAGCFTGPITTMAGAGDLTIVFEAPDTTTHNLVGCLHITNPLVDGTHVGVVRHDNQSEALITVMPAQFPGFFSVRAVKSPPGDSEDAQTVTLINESGTFPFSTADDLTRCTLTCANLAGPQSFAPMVAP